jgi:hypothetical protein
MHSREWRAYYSRGNSAAQWGQQIFCIERNAAPTMISRLLLVTMPYGMAVTVRHPVAM